MLGMVNRTPVGLWHHIPKEVLHSLHCLVSMHWTRESRRLPWLHLPKQNPKSENEMIHKSCRTKELVDALVKATWLANWEVCTVNMTVCIYFILINETSFTPSGNKQKHEVGEQSQEWAPWYCSLKSQYSDIELTQNQQLKKGSSK